MFRYVVVNSQGLRNNRLRCNAFNNSNSTRGATLHTGTYGMIKILLRHNIYSTYIDVDSGALEICLVIKENMFNIKLICFSFQFFFSRQYRM